MSANLLSGTEPLPIRVDDVGVPAAGRAAGLPLGDLPAPAGGQGRVMEQRRPVRVVVAIVPFYRLFPGIKVFNVLDFWSHLSCTTSGLKRNSAAFVLKPIGSPIPPVGAILPMVTLGDWPTLHCLLHQMSHDSLFLTHLDRASTAWRFFRV